MNRKNLLEFISKLALRGFYSAFLFISLPLEFFYNV